MGAILISTLLGATLWGMTVVQAYEYFLDYPKDSKVMKSLVLAVCLLDTVHQALNSHTVYVYLVTHFADVAFLATNTWSLVGQVVPSALNSLLVQCFFVHRIYELHKRINRHRSVCICSIIMLLVLGNFSSSMAYLIKGVQMESVAGLTGIAYLSHTINGFACGADIAITIVLVTLLQWSKTGRKKTNHILNQLIVYSLNTGALTSIFTIACLISLLALPTSMLYIAFYEILCRLYSNSLLATLNARARIHMQLITPTTIPEGGAMVPTLGLRSSTFPHFATGSQHHVSISVAQNTRKELDSDDRTETPDQKSYELGTIVRSAQSANSELA